MKKIISFLMLLCFLGLSAGLVKAEEIVYDAYNIVTSPGEDASTEMNVNYHTSNTLTSLEYSVFTDAAYAEKTVVTGVTTVFESLDDPTGHRVEVGFEKRNIVQVFLQDLVPGTKYRYRINKGNGTYTDDYSFTTASATDGTSFLFVTDAHVFGTEAVYDGVVSQALAMDPDLGFVLTAGDMVDRGGNATVWNNFFTYSSNLKTVPMIGTPGNHEYYHYLVGEIDARYFNAFFSSPKNGPEQYLNSTSYFVYNNILFVQLDTVSKLFMDRQIEWFENVVETHPTKYIVVTAHKPFQNYAESWFPIFERYSVDLVLTGHSHTHNYRANIYGEQPAADPNLGVTYLTGDGAGTKSDTGTGYLIQVADNKINITRYDQTGIIKTFTLDSKRPEEFEPITKDDFMKSLTTYKDLTNYTAKIIWSEKAYKNILRVDLKDNLRALDQSSYVATPSHTFINLDHTFNGYQYDYTATVTFSDNTTMTKDFEFDFSPNANPKVTLDPEDPTKATFDVTYNENIPNFSYYEIYLNNEQVAKSYKLLNFKTSFNLKNLLPDTYYTVVVKAVDNDDLIIFSDYAHFQTPEAQKKGCLSGALIPSTLLMGLGTLAAAFFTLRKKG